MVSSPLHVDLQNHPYAAHKAVLGFEWVGCSPKRGLGSHLISLLACCLCPSFFLYYISDSKATAGELDHVVMNSHSVTKTCAVSGGAAAAYIGNSPVGSSAVGVAGPHIDDVP